MAPIPPSIPITAIIHVIVANTLVIVLALGLLEVLSSLGSSVFFSSVKIEGILGSDSSPSLFVAVDSSIGSTPSTVGTGFVSSLSLVLDSLATTGSTLDSESCPVSSIGSTSSTIGSLSLDSTLGSSFFLGLEVFFFLGLDSSPDSSPSDSSPASISVLSSTRLGCLLPLLFVFFNVLFFFLF